MKRREQGFSVVLMIALIVLVGGMLAYTVSLGTTMSAAMAQEIGAARAAQAAQAGLEWGKFRVRQAAANCVAVTNLTMPLASGAMPVTVRCTPTVTNEGGTSVTIFHFDVTACRPAAAGTCPNAAGSGDYVEQVATGNAEP